MKSWSEFEFLPGAVDAIRAFRKAGLRVVVVTNQRGVALGRMTLGDVADIHSRMLAELDGAVDSIKFCPHEAGRCDCRKPGIGLFLEARAEVPEIDFQLSVVIGDSASDMQAGRSVGARLVMIGDPGREEVDHSASSLAAAARWLLP